MTTLTDILTLIVLAGTAGGMIVGMIAGLYRVAAVPRRRFASWMSVISCCDAAARSAVVGWTPVKAVT